MSRHELLAGLHLALRPATYVEIGVHDGHSLRLSRCRSIGIDPAFDIREEIRCDLQLVKATSDEFFGREGAFAHFDGMPVDLAFIDGMHLADFAYRDFANMEAHMAAAGVVVLDDMLPRNDEEAARNRTTKDWTGDVYKVAGLLRELRPDLIVLTVNTAPTGTVVVVGLDPSSRRLHDSYDSVLDRLLAADPQHVPQEILDRVGALDPVQLLADPAWEQLRDLRAKGAQRDELAPVLEALRALT